MSSVTSGTNATSPTTSTFLKGTPPLQAGAARAVPYEQGSRQSQAAQPPERLHRPAQGDAESHNQVQQVPKQETTEDYVMAQSMLPTSTTPPLTEQETTLEQTVYDAKLEDDDTGGNPSVSNGQHSAGEHRGLHPTFDVFNDSEKDDRRSDELHLCEVKDEANTGEEPQDDGSTNEEDYEDEVGAADATTNPGDNPPSSSCAPPEPEGPPPTLSLRQKRRLQQLLQEGELQRRTAEETDEMLWKRFRGQQKEEYRGYRKAQRRRGEWLPDRWRGDGRRGNGNGKGERGK